MLELEKLLKYIATASFALNGLKVISTTYNGNHNFGVLTAIEDVTFTATSTVGSGEADKNISLTLTSGSSLYGAFNNVRVSSGSLIGYLR